MKKILDMFIYIYLHLVHFYYPLSAIVHVFSLFTNFLPFEKGMVLHLNILISLSTRMLCAKIGCGSGEKNENVESLKTDGRIDRYTDGQTDGRRSEKV